MRAAFSDAEFAKRNQIKTIEIIGAEGQHPLCRIAFLLEDDRQIAGLGRLIGTTLTVSADEDEEILFHGCIRTISGGSTFLKAEAVVEAVSFSAELDKRKRNRIFQSPDKTCGEVLKTFGDEKIQVRIAESGLGERTVPLALVQYQETDFEFVKRLAGYYGMKVFVDASHSSIVPICIGGFADDVPEKLEEAKIVRQEFVLEEGRTIVKLQYKGYLNLGKLVKINKSSFVVCRVRLLKAAGGETCEYILSAVSAGGAHPAPAEQEQPSYMLGTAKVISREDPDHLGRIQVAYQDVEDCVTGKRQWIPYISPLTESGGGISFVPDPDETVEVICRSGQCAALGCLRVKELDEDCRNTEDRIVQSRGKTIILGREKAEVQAFDSRLVLEEKAARIYKGSVEIVTDGDLITLTAGNTKINLSKDRIQMLAKALDMKGTDSIGIKSNKVDLATGHFNVTK